MNFTVAESKLQPFWQEKDRKETLKAFRDVFERQAPLDGPGWVVFVFVFLNKDKIWIPWKIARDRAVFISQDRGGWKWHTGAPSDLREVAVISPAGPESRDTWRSILHENIQHHKCFWTGKCHTTSCSALWHASLQMPTPPQLVV